MFRITIPYISFGVFAIIASMTTQHKLPLLMVDTVLLTLLGESLHVGLAQRNNPNEPFFGAWTLPGGFVRPEEDLDAEATARRVLLTKAGVETPYLEQLATFSGALRDSRGWSASIAYYALVPSHVAPDSSESFRWTPVDEISALPFDHLTILNAALERVRSKTSYSALPLHLAPNEFTMAELRAVYESVLGGRIESRMFERRIAEMGVVEPTGKTKSSGGKPGKIYRKRRSKSLAFLAPSIVTTK
jgi:ADP-ribose pyrophosphatase YjhB (NUDIX family)